MIDYQFLTIVFFLALLFGGIVGIPLGQLVALWLFNRRNR